jgi:hypothetical protein
VTAKVIDGHTEKAFDCKPCTAIASLRFGHFVQVRAQGGTIQSSTVPHCPQILQQFRHYKMSDNSRGLLPGIALSQVESNITQTFGLADPVLTAAKEPMVYLHKAYRKQAMLKRIIGGWQNEARDQDNEYRTPVLHEKDFLAHLLQNDAILCPTDDAPAKSCWAYFLHAHAIRPGMGLVGWIPSTNADIDSIDMEIDGAVLGHVMNLYREPERYRHDALVERDENLRCATFPFGKLI